MSTPDMGAGPRSAHPRTTSPVICTPRWSEWAALHGVVSAAVTRGGRGASRRIEAAGPLLVAGVAAALTDELRPGDLVVADQLRTTDTATASPAAPLLFAALRRQGLRVRLGPLLSLEHVADKAGLVAAASGAIAADTESAFLARQAPAGQTVALHAVADTPSARLRNPGTAWRGVAALRALRAATPAVDQWAAAAGEHEILLASPRSFCAGVERAVRIVERAL